jgi:hypothetical protein
MKILKILLAVLFAPVAIASTRAFFSGLNSLSFLNVNLFLLAGGFFAYPVLHIIFLKPMYIYALGHEIVHVLATWLCGGKITSFHISSGGGSVTTTKTNLFIRLSPYFVPIHTLFLGFLFWVISRFYDLSGFLNEFIFLVGFMMSFHIFMTIEVMKIRQPDIVKAGYLFSIFFIYAANIAVIFLVLSVVFKDISFMSFAKSTFIFAKSIYLSVFGRLL